MDNNNVWYIAEYPDYCRNCILPHKVILGKDTIINNNSYKSILHYSGDSIESKISKPNIFGYVRETIDKKVYWFIGFNGSSPSDNLLFDFNANINDTIISPDGAWIVTKIDSVIIKNKFKRRIALKSICNEPLKFWIEEIGDMSDLFNSPSCIFINGSEYFISDNSYFKQTCFLKGSEIVYKDSSTTNCWNYKNVAY
jgi:hypothetical protein